MVLFTRNCYRLQPVYLTELSSHLAWDLHWQRHLRDLLETSQKRRLFCDVFKTSQIDLKKDIFLCHVFKKKHLKNISKKMCFVWCLEDVSSISQKRRLFRDFPETSQKHLLQVFVIFQKFPTKMISFDFRRLITISDEIDVGPLETLKKWNIFWKQCIDISQVCYQSGLISAWQFWQVNDRQSQIVGY